MSKRPLPISKKRRKQHNRKKAKETSLFSSVTTHSFSWAQCCLAKDISLVSKLKTKCCLWLGGSSLKVLDRVGRGQYDLFGPFSTLDYEGKGHTMG